MELLGGIILLALVVGIVYKMMSKKETIQEAAAEVVKDVETKAASVAAEVTKEAEAKVATAVEAAVETAKQVEAKAVEAVEEKVTKVKTKAVKVVKDFEYDTGKVIEEVATKVKRTRKPKA